MINDRVTDDYSKELEKNCYKCHCYCLLIERITNNLFDSYMSNSLTDIPTEKKKTLME